MTIKNYETVLVFTPVLSEKEVKERITKYMDFLKAEGAEIIQKDFWGLKQLAYPIQKKTTGIYFVTEFKGTGETVDKMEVNLKRDNEMMRFLTVRLDKYAIKYNEDRRNGLIGKKKPVETPENTENAEATDTAAAPTAAVAPEATAATDTTETTETNA